MKGHHHYTFRLVLAIIVAVMMTACTGQSPEDNQGAINLLNEYYQDIQSGDLDRATALYPEKDRAKWGAFLRANQERLGALKKFQIDHMETNTVYSGIYFVFTMDAQYEKHDATEIITIFQEVDQKHPWLNYHKTK